MAWNKYHSKKITCDGIRFDSVHECERYQELRLLERAGEIRDLQRQVSFTLIPAQYVNGKLRERACRYVADFAYHRGDDYVVEDAKGVRTAEYIIKR